MIKDAPAVQLFYVVLGESDNRDLIVEPNFVD